MFGADGQQCSSAAQSDCAHQHACQENSTSKGIGFLDAWQSDADRVPDRVQALVLDDDADYGRISMDSVTDNVLIFIQPHHEAGLQIPFYPIGQPLLVDRGRRLIVQGRRSVLSVHRRLPDADICEPAQLGGCSTDLLPRAYDPGWSTQCRPPDTEAIRVIMASEVSR